MNQRRTSLLAAALSALLLLCTVGLCLGLAGCGKTPDDGPVGTDTEPADGTGNAEDADSVTEPGTFPVTEPATEADTTPDFDPVPPNFTADDVSAHREIPLFADMEIPFYDEKVGLAPTIAPYLVEGSTACVVIFPGGGYFQRTDGGEGIEIAEAYNAAGLSAFVVRYRYDAAGVSGSVTYDRHAIMADAQRAVQFVRYYADEFGISRDKVAVCGFSAGGHLAMVIAEHADELYEGASESAIGWCDSHPDALVLGYPLVNMKNAYYTVPIIFLNGEQKDPDAIAKYSYTYRLEALPPTFMFAYKKDDTVSVRLNAQAMQKDMEEAGLRVECYLFNDGAHGIGLGKNYADYSRWHDLSVAFLKDVFGQ
ncbi:MAG: alpha/beta hydrolase [Clostridia bacterium]|nr:alpha/beta hydrolase [Clostridia bacterium]